MTISKMVKKEKKTISKTIKKEVWKKCMGNVNEVYVYVVK